MLAALLAHLGSGSRSQMAVALGALHHLSCQAPLVLGQYGSYLANVLDHLDVFTIPQLRQVVPNALLKVQLCKQPFNVPLGLSATSRPGCCSSHTAADAALMHCSCFRC